jgi:hypothetical protein
MLATSSGVAARWMIEVGRRAFTKAKAASSMGGPVFSAICFTFASKPSDSH